MFIVFTDLVLFCEKYNRSIRYVCGLETEASAYSVLASAHGVGGLPAERVANGPGVVASAIAAKDALALAHVPALSSRVGEFVVNEAHGERSAGEVVGLPLLLIVGRPRPEAVIVLTTP